jgi:uncharacterized membrane protein
LRIGQDDPGRRSGLGEGMKEFLWWAGHFLLALLSIASILIGFRVVSIGTKDPINFILSLTLLMVGVILLIHFIARMGERIRLRRHEE